MPALQFSTHGSPVGLILCFPRRGRAMGTLPQKVYPLVQQTDLRFSKLIGSRWLIAQFIRPFRVRLRTLGVKYVNTAGAVECNYMGFTYPILLSWKQSLATSSEFNTCWLDCEYRWFAFFLAFWWDHLHCENAAHKTSSEKAAWGTGSFGSISKGFIINAVFESENSHMQLRWCTWDKLIGIMLLAR